MQPAFHRKRIAAMGQMMTNAATELIQRWQPAAARGQSVLVDQEMMQLTLRIAGLALFSVELSGEANSVGQAVTRGSEFFNYRSSKLLPFPLWVPTRWNRQFRYARHVIDQLVYQIIAHRHHHPDEHDDLLAMLMEVRDEESGEAMADQQLRNEVVTMLTAGHETTSNTLTWTFVLLAQHPEVEERLHAELTQVLGERTPQVDDLPRLPYLRNVLEESMRLYPPAWGLARQSIEEDEVGGFPIAPGSSIVLAPYTMHRHPAFWEEPERFDPERFSDSRSAQRPKFAYFPFGGGPRQCIGNIFALTEAQLILAQVIQHFQLRLVPGHPIAVEPLITLRPKYPIHMTLHER